MFIFQFWKCYINEAKALRKSTNGKDQTLKQLATEIGKIKKMSKQQRVDNHRTLVVNLAVILILQILISISQTNYAISHL